MNRILTGVAIGLLSALAFAQSAPVANTPAGNNSEPAKASEQGQTPAGQPQAQDAASGAQTQGTAGQTPAPDAPNAVEKTVERKQPTTEILPDDKPLPSADPLMEPAELPRGTVTLIGGLATRVDRVRNRVTLQPFGGGKKVSVRFDDRSHIYRDGRETTVTAIKEGDRVYADTMLVGPYVFAKSIRVQTSSGPAEARGQITRYDARSGRVTIVDQLTSQPVIFTVSNETSVVDPGGKSVAPQDIVLGALIEVRFVPGQGRGGQAREVALLAKPGQTYVFAGRVTYVDLRSNLLSLDNQTDSKKYELLFDPGKVDELELLKIGAEVTIRATFDGKNYRAANIAIARAADSAARQ